VPSRSGGAAASRSGGRSGHSSQAAVRGSTEPDRWIDPDDGPADPESVARLICLRLLTAAPRTRAQLADALRRRRVPADAAENVLSRFSEVGLINDAMFASAWVESRHYGRGLGRRALAAELGQRGVAQGDIVAAVDQLSTETERATALALVERKIASTAGRPEAARARRLVGMLARKGYPAGLAYSVVREALGRAGQDSLDRAGQGSLAPGPDEDETFAFEFAEDDELDESAE
jgi:regulatory protein